MSCFVHPEKAARANCASCGSPLCDDCIVHTQGSIYCRSCLTGAVPHPKPFGVNKFLLFLFAVCLPPGSGYMYMGLIKRGLSAMIGFFFVIFLLSSGITGLPQILFAFAIPIIYLACIFDSFVICRRINSGEAVEDGIDGIINSLLSNKKLCALIFIILAIIFAGNILGFALRVIQVTAPIMIIGFGLYILFRRKK